jgi:nicotinate-nucleotide adenylyltransferase
MSLGILGGTFDPVHLGHLRAAEAVRESLSLERVVFVPAARPPHRPEPVASGLDRFAMVALATAHHPAFAASDQELRRGGRSYSVDTLEAIATAHPGRSLVLILGSDALRDLPSWHRVERVRELARIATVERPGSGTQDLPGMEIERVEAPLLDVSSTEVRRRLAEGLSVRYLVPESVADYIAKRELYT